MNTIFIVTEANATVATGHLMECIVCAEELMESGYDVSFWINDDMEEGLKKRIPCMFWEYHISIENDYEMLLKEICKTHPNAVLFNLRELSEKFSKICRKAIDKTISIICIDEFGHRNLQADIIVNPMIDSYYWNYGESDARLFCGAQYLFLAKDTNRFHKMKKIIKEDIGNILISMGGEDPQNYTIFLIREIPICFPDAEINIVLGGGNKKRGDIYRKAEGSARIRIYENISNMPEMIYHADLIICAGGNTLHEAACVGTPAIVLPSMPHEVRTARCFADGGFGCVINVENNLRDKLWEACENMRDYSVRRRMSDKGKGLSDGLGLKHVMDIIKTI